MLLRLVQLVDVHDGKVSRLPCAGLSSWMPLIIGFALAAFAIGVFLASRRAPNDDDEDDELELGEMPPPDDEDDVGRRAVSRRAEPISGREHVLDELRD